MYLLEVLCDPSLSKVLFLCVGVERSDCHFAMRSFGNDEWLH